MTVECLRRTFEALSEAFVMPNFGGDSLESQDVSEAVSDDPAASKKRKREYSATKGEERALSKPYSRTKGHTGFLTFARKPLPKAFKP